MASKSPLRSDRIHSNADVRRAEKVLAEIAKLPPAYGVKIVDAKGRDVRGDARLRTLRKNGR